MRKILGEHKWKKILAHPRKEDEYGYSQIFPCALSTADVRKSGRSRLRVNIHPHFILQDGEVTKSSMNGSRTGPRKRSECLADLWRGSIDASARFNVNPYPTPDFCEPPHEDITGLPLCRKLPKAFRPPPVVAPKPAGGGPTRFSP